MIARIRIIIETVMPTGTDYWRMFLTNLFFMRFVLGSKARITPGKPIQAKFKRDISIGAKGYSKGRIVKRTARMVA